MLRRLLAAQIRDRCVRCWLKRPLRLYSPTHLAVGCAVAIGMNRAARTRTGS